MYNCMTVCKCLRENLEKLCDRQLVIHHHQNNNPYWPLLSMDFMHHLQLPITIILASKLHMEQSLLVSITLLGKPTGQLSSVLIPSENQSVTEMKTTSRTSQENRCFHSSDLFLVFCCVLRLCTLRVWAYSKTEAEMALVCRVSLTLENLSEVCVYNALSVIYDLLLVLWCCMYVRYGNFSCLRNWSNPTCMLHSCMHWKHWMITYCTFHSRILNSSSDDTTKSLWERLMATSMWKTFTTRSVMLRRKKWLERGNYQADGLTQIHSAFLAEQTQSLL